jgi:hypothetical protein
MFFNDHAPPHFHARYGEFEATIDIDTLSVVQGELPRSRTGGFAAKRRNQDGLSGHVRLRQEELTGALALLRDTGFFEQVFIDRGAIAWPGEIDLAPDAMHADVLRDRR